MKFTYEMPFVCKTVCRSSIMSGVYPSSSYKREQIKQMKKCVKDIGKKKAKTQPGNIDMHRPSSR